MTVVINSCPALTRLGSPPAVVMVMPPKTSITKATAPARPIPQRKTRVTRDLALVAGRQPRAVRTPEEGLPGVQKASLGAIVVAGVGSVTTAMRDSHNSAPKAAWTVCGPAVLQVIALGPKPEALVVIVNVLGVQSAGWIMTV